MRELGILFTVVQAVSIKRTYWY